MDAGKDELVVEVIFRESPYRNLAVSLIPQGAVCLQQLDTDKDVRVPVAWIDEPGLHIGDDFLLRDLRCLAAEAVYSIVFRGEIDILHHKKPHRIVQAAVLVEVR